ncbi:DUF4382 domain-containing protein [Geobacter sp. DSM 9736]|uniref:DUF4382 domain-containing protein n=1 Tax=Geobacter sp. DSM 9736 TaxID=1277350 RepID=UPI000B50101E|nr:DUF4382 domain-containing protein [Geobacter sp. DSM 9736]SNB46298.1 protein of unknown function [Geobacter sp. DSM 9736]
MRRGCAFNRMLSTVCAVVLALGLAACGGGGGGSSTAQSGTLKVGITDKQSDDFAQVVIAIREIRVVPAGRENAPDNDPGLPVLARFSSPRVIDVMQLQFVQQALGEIILPAGTYSQIRLILEPNPNGQGQPPANYLTLKTDPAARIPLKTPSGQQSGLKVLGPVEVRPGAISAVLIDFDPNTAIVPRGNGDYNLKPTGIRLVQTGEELTRFGSITGTVSSTFKDWSSATVSIRRRGDINDVEPIAAGRIFSSYTSGRWQAPFAAFVPPSTQTVSYKAFIAASGFGLYSSTAVAVTEGQATDIGEIQFFPAP